MEHDDGTTEPKPLAPASRPLMDPDGVDTSFTAAAGGGAMALALARGLRTPGWPRTASIVMLAVVAIGLLALLATSLF